MLPSIDVLPAPWDGGMIGVSSDLSVTRLAYVSDAAAEVCTGGFDVDHDGLIGCADDDCWGVCAPTCAPPLALAEVCDPEVAEPRCGDGTCSGVESCRLCPADCGACTPVCGDHLCDAGEACPGDCPP
ncbi:MAG: hypothetical protein R2939_00785 [Kofleriaceae bacterium]